jgi:hypothetical protein
VSAVSRRQLFKAFVFWRSSAPRAAEDFWHANEYLRRAVTCVEVRNDPALKAALRSCVLRSAKTERGWLQLQACCFDTDGVYLGPSLATYANGLTDEVLLDGGAAQVTGEGFCVDRVGRSSLPYVINEGDAWVAAVDAALAHHALILRRLHGDPRCRRPSQRRASIKNFRESKPAFPPPTFEERALIPSNPQVASPREVAAGVLEVAQTGSSSRRTGLHSLIVKSGYLLYERLPGVWRRRFLKLRAVSFDVASRYAGPCVESSLDEDSEPLATFPLDSTRVRSAAPEAGLHPMLFVDSASGASERFAAATRRDRDAWLQAVEAAREQHLTVVDSLRGNQRPPPPPNEESEPERTHLFRFGVNASKKFQCVHCSFRGTYDEVSVHERSCPDGGLRGILSCSARNWNQARYELKGGALVGDGQRFELRGASVRSAEPCGFDVEAPGRGPVSFVCATAVERDGWVRALSRVCRLATP